MSLTLWVEFLCVMNSFVTLLTLWLLLALNGPVRVFENWQLFQYFLSIVLSHAVRTFVMLNERIRPVFWVNSIACCHLTCLYSSVIGCLRHHYLRSFVMFLLWFYWRICRSSYITSFLVFLRGWSDILFFESRRYKRCSKIWILVINEVWDIILAVLRLSIYLSTRLLRMIWRVLIDS